MSFGPRLRRWCLIWCLLFGATVIAVAISLQWLDLPLARMFRGHARHLASMGVGLGSRVLIAGEVVVMAWLAIRRLVKGNLSLFGKAMFVSCCASLSAFTVNDYVLKYVFGRPNPGDFFHSAQ